MNVTITTYVEYLLPGAMFSESETKEVSNRVLWREAKQAPEQAFAFCYYEIVTAEVPLRGGELVKLSSDARNKSGRYYIGGDLFTQEEIAAMGPDFRILYSNMRSNGWNKVLKTRSGNWQLLQEGDHIVRIR